MSLSDCERCWETPCVCGHDYRNWPSVKLTEFIKMLQGVLDKKLASDDEVLVTDEWAEAVLPDAWFMEKTVRGGWLSLYTQKRNRLVMLGLVGQVDRQKFRKVCAEQRIKLKETANG